MKEAIELSIVMPCLNEAETLEICIKKAKSYLKKNNIIGEIIIGDNGSTDGSQEIAINNGARVIDVSEKGYGNALKGGINAAKGKFVIMGDADDSYDFSNLNPFIEQLRNGFDLVMGNRFKGGIEKNAMPFLHKYLGNPVLSFLGKLFFGIWHINDFHCGLRGFSKESYKKMELITNGMEFASEFVVKASLNNMKLIEVPTTLSPDGRTRAPHLKTWPDGWRHLKFLLMYSPSWLFKFPGLIISLLSLILMSCIIIKPISIGNITLDINTAIYSSFSFLLGLQLIFFYYFAKQYVISNKFIPKTQRKNKFLENWNLEKGIILGLVLFISGLILTYFNLKIWGWNDFGNLDHTMIRRVIPAVLLLFVGVQTIFYSFMVDVLKLK